MKTCIFLLSLIIISSLTRIIKAYDTQFTTIYDKHISNSEIPTVENPVFYYDEIFARAHFIQYGKYYQFQFIKLSGNLNLSEIYIESDADCFEYVPALGYYISRTAAMDDTHIIFTIDKNDFNPGAYCTYKIRLRYHTDPQKVADQEWSDESDYFQISIQSPSLSGVYELCGSIENFTLSNYPSGVSSIQWESSSNLTFPNGNTGSVVQIEPINPSVNEASYLKPKYIFPSGLELNCIQFSKWVGIPAQPTTNPTGYPTVQMSLGQLKTIYAANGPGATNYSWNATGSITRVSSPSGPQITVEATSLGSGQFFCYGVNNCGTSSSPGGGAVWVSSGGGGGMLMVYPNPGSNIVEISFTDEFKKNEENFNENTSLFSDYTLKIYNRSGIPVYNDNFLNSKQIDVSDWQKGTYHVMVYDQEESFSTSFVVE